MIPLAGTPRAYVQYLLADVTWVLVASAAIVLVASPIAMWLYRKER